MPQGPAIRLERDDALICVDVQNDFLPGGSLAVADGDQILAPLNALITRFRCAGLPIFATADWHPPNHCSFREQGGPWPSHCVAGSRGAEFAPGLQLPDTARRIRKGTRPAHDAYSGFEGTDLAAQLWTLGVRRVFIGGLATDYCVRATAQDALAAGFAVVLLTDAMRAVSPADGERALQELKAAGAQWAATTSVAALAPAESSALLTDFYQLTMLQAYFDRQMFEPAVFELFVRRLPPQRNFLVAAGLEQALEFLENLHFGEAELAWIAARREFRPAFVDFLAGLRFRGEVHAMPEGTVFFAQEPILRVTAPLPQAQLVESRLINLLHFQTLVASKAVRAVLAAPERQLVDFGLRRSHGAEAGLLAARASYLAGFTGTATTLAAMRFDIPVYGTMAHSFVQAHGNETEAFASFAHSLPGQVILLIDTFDIERACRDVIALAPRLQRQGIAIHAVRIDSGDLAAHARRVRGLLDAAGLRDLSILASGDLDEERIHGLLAAGAPIDGFGIGTRLDTSADVPYLDCAYKLHEYAGRPLRKRSEGKATWPGRKQVFRRIDEQGLAVADVVTLEDEPQHGVALLQPVMREGRRCAPAPSLQDSRDHLRAQLRQLPPALRGLRPAAQRYPVHVGPALQSLIRRVDGHAPAGASARRRAAGAMPPSPAAGRAAGTAPAATDFHGEPNMRVGEVCNRTVVIIEGDAGIVRAAQLMREHHVGSLVLVRREGEVNYPVGILTDRDLVVEVLAAEAPLERLTVADVVTQPLVTVDQNEDLMQAFDRMRDKGIRRMPVVNAQCALVGLLAVDDVLEILAELMSRVPQLIHREQAAEARLRH